MWAQHLGGTLPAESSRCRILPVGLTPANGELTYNGEKKGRVWVHT